MEYDLLKHRSLQPDANVESMKLLYFYSKYRKDREEAAKNTANANNRVHRVR